MLEKKKERQRIGKGKKVQERNKKEWKKEIKVKLNLEKNLFPFFYKNYVSNPRSYFDEQ